MYELTLSYKEAAIPFDKLKRLAIHSQRSTCVHWGDKRIDEADLEVLMSHWGEEILPVELISYWKLDEADSDIAYDSAGEYDGTLNGEPIWQPTGGMVNGTLQFDGIDDYISTPNR